MSTLALCPSRNRPGAAHDTLASFEATRRDPGSRLVFVLDSDDETAAAYPAGHVHIVKPGGSMGAALWQASHDQALLGDATSVGMVGDDNRWRTPGWDLILDGWLTENIGVAYGDDGFQHERLPTSWWLSRPLVDLFGMADRSLRHFYMDNWALELGRATGILRYFPDVSIEHLHPLAGKAPNDATYDRAKRFAAVDRTAFQVWKRRGLAANAQRVRALIASRRPQRILADWHHPALWESLELLFTDRLGWELYAPHGLEWTAHGWNIGPYDGIGWKASDYLEPPGARDRGDHLEVTGAEYPDRPRKVVTWEQARGQNWDFVLGSVAKHQRPFAELARTMKARFVHQVGNAKHQIDRSIPQIVLASSRIPPGIPRAVIYHQEFSRALFGPAAPPPNRLVVAALMLRLESTSGPYEWLANAPGVAWSAVGGRNPDAAEYLAPMTSVAARMAAAGWIWHDKLIGDGYGHVIWSAASMGRPLIGHASHYAGLLGAPLWRDLETCVDLDRHDPVRALRLIRAISADPGWYDDISAATIANFEALVDFDAEAEEIRTILFS